MCTDSLSSRLLSNIVGMLPWILLTYNYSEGLGSLLSMGPPVASPKMTMLSQNELPVGSMAKSLVVFGNGSACFFFFFFFFVS